MAFHPAGLASGPVVNGGVTCPVCSVVEGGQHLGPHPDPAPLKTVMSVVVMKDGGKWTEYTKYTDGSTTAVDVTDVVTKLSSLESDGKGGHRRKPRPRALFDLKEMPRDHWCWMVESRRRVLVCLADSVVEMWGDFEHRREHAPYGFCDRASALRRKLELMRGDAYNIGLGIVEYHVTPHYLGYRPHDESWFAREYHPPVPTVDGPLFSPPPESTE
jgi:hypothetical protein